jgi:hypothetical protein
MRVAAEWVPDHPAEKSGLDCESQVGTERENLALDAKGNDKWQTP